VYSLSSVSVGPCMIFINKVPPGFSVGMQNSSISLLRRAVRMWSMNLSPMKVGTASEHMISALLKSSISETFSIVFFSEMSPYTILTPGIGTISNLSTATTFSGPLAGLFGLYWIWMDSTFSAMICDQPPGAAPRSITLIPG
jgi:hypothetical protein